VGFQKNDFYKVESLIIPIHESVATLLGIKNQSQQGFSTYKMATPFCTLVLEVVLSAASNLFWYD
jgi:hypothetical protein